MPFFNFHFDFDIYIYMLNQILLNKTNLLHNLHYLENYLQGKKICVMVKANAYGHGMAEVAQCLQKEKVSYGVSNQDEALALRKLTDKQIIVFGACENYHKLMQNNIDFAVFSFEMVKKICKIAKTYKLKPQMHLCLNSGMNRYGINQKNEFFKIVNFLAKQKLQLSGFYTHFSSLTTDEKYSERQKRMFYEFCYALPKEWQTITHVGGGKTVFKDIDAKMFRTGIEIYGYGDQNLRPVMSIKSQIVDTVRVKAGEHVGYLCGFTAKTDMLVGAIPLGYADGLPRNLSNKLTVFCKDKHLQNVGNICMDCFMVDLAKSKAKVGDEVLIMQNASSLASTLGTTEYEVLTNFGHFRGIRRIVGE